MSKNLYYAWASNQSGASTDVNHGHKETSRNEIKRIARAELGSGWTVHVMQIGIDGDGQSVFQGSPSEVETFKIR